MRKSLLNDIHETEAKEFRSYCEWEMPAIYTSPEHEYDAAIRSVALTDRSYFGRIVASGRDRLDLLHRMSTNDLLRPGPDEISSTVFTTEKGRIVDAVTILPLLDSLMLLASPGNEDTFTGWIDKYTIMEDIKLEVITSSTSQFSLLGPQSRQCAADLFGLDLIPHRVTKFRWKDIELIVNVSTEFHTEIVNIISDGAHATDLWNNIESQKPGIVKMGTIAYEGFRISHGIPAIGHEISDLFNPFEAGLQHAISFTKGCYIGQEVIARLDTYQKVQRRLVGLVFSHAVKGARSHSKLMNQTTEVGVLTSLMEFPIHTRQFGTAIVRRDSVQEGDHLYLDTDALKNEGIVTGFPIR